MYWMLLVIVIWYVSYLMVYILCIIYEIIESINFCSWFLILICCKKLNISVYDKYFFLENKGFIYIFKGLEYKMCKFVLCLIEWNWKYVG